jgi:hypothetical protein
LSGVEGVRAASTADGLFVGLSKGDANSFPKPAAFSPFVARYDRAGNLISGAALSGFLSGYLDLFNIDVSTGHIYVIGTKAGEYRGLANHSS